MKTKTKILIAKLVHIALIKILKFDQKKIIKRNSINWYLDLTEGLDMQIFLLGSFQRKIINSIIKIILHYNKKSTNFHIIDIGSHAGEMSLLSAKNLLNKKYRNFKIFSIEPTLYAFNKQKRNLNLNLNLKKKISLFNYFITDKKQKPKKIYSSWKLDRGLPEHKMLCAFSKKTSKVSKPISLDYFVKKHKIKDTTIIKIDVDGHELNVLKSGKEFIRKKEPIIIMEYAPYLLKEHGFSIKDLYSFIKKYKYQIFSLNFKKLNKIEIADGASTDIILLKKESLAYNFITQ